LQKLINLGLFPCLTTFISLELESPSSVPVHLLFSKCIYEHFSLVEDLRLGRYNGSMLSPSDLQSSGIKVPHILLTGDPGSGKSYSIETITELATKMKMGHVITTSYMVLLQ
jgi:hypothetical protein